MLVSAGRMSRSHSVSADSRVARCPGTIPVTAHGTKIRWRAGHGGQYPLQVAPHALPSVHLARKTGLSIHGNWIIGLPGETKETIKATERLIKETKADAITVAVITPFPGTELYTWAKENGYLITEDPNEYLDERGHQKSIISYPELSSVEIRQAVDRILKGYYLSPSYVPIALKRVFSRHGLNELKVLWRSAVAFLKYISNK